MTEELFDSKDDDVRAELKFQAPTSAPAKNSQRIREEVPGFQHTETHEPYFTCENKITVAHDDQRVINRMIKAYYQDRLFEEFVPCPNNFGRNEYGATNGRAGKKMLGMVDHPNRETWIGCNWGRQEKDANAGISLEIISPNRIAFTIFTILKPPLGLLDHWVDIGCSVSCASFDEDEMEHTNLQGQGVLAP
jgi:hypothetical protein